MEAKIVMWRNIKQLGVLAVGVFGKGILGFLGILGLLLHKVSQRRHKVAQREEF